MWVYEFIKIKSPGERGNYREWKQQNKIQNNPILPLHKIFKLKKSTWKIHLKF